MNYTIAAVSSQVNDYQGQYGPMKEYRIKLNSMGNTVIAMSQKAATPPPKVGDAIEGTVDMSSKYGPKFKKDFSQKPGGGSGSGGGRSAPRDEAAIRAQFAIKAAVQLYGSLNPDVREGIKDGTEWIETQADKFYAMVDKVKTANASTDDAAKQEMDEFNQALTDSFGSDVEDITAYGDNGGF